MSLQSNPDKTTNLDQDLKASRLAKYNNTELIDETKQWLATILRGKIDESDLISSDLVDYLKDGTALCELINSIWGEGSLKYRNSTIPFMQMENIEKFLTFIKLKGVPQDELFQTVDLYQEKDPYQVLLTLQTLSQFIHKTMPEQGYPLIGPAIAKRHEPPKVPKKPKYLKGEGWSTAEYGYMGGSNQATEHIIFGARRNIGNRPQDMQ